MRIKKIEKRLSKINRVFNAFKDDGNISRIEKDLLLGYVRDLYDLIIDNEEEAIVTNDQILVKQPKTQIFEKKDIPIKEEQKPIEDIEITEEIKVEPIVEEIIEVEKNDNNISLSDELEEIFTINEGNDLSDKLASSPISDISKAMGINERYFTISELFGGDSEGFVETCDALNNFSSFDQAKSFLVDIAIKYEWESGAKMKKAHNFIKHLNRKYL